ncbi:hypothetical protein [Iodobacter fluviatilis]|uniref:Uncharacterized protein n=1 Tax=Iodobacter fluviatilis TaxID=537 RepID=A0A7G3G5P7_9NEIS|nr:hypothetical protein [Iodobacter fluviatilis]QBC42383.1 hypothetical protein C1H71_01600 [Iodobacter fluviatilis]
MITIKKCFYFILFVFEPLFFKGRWIMWFFAFLLLMMMGNTITAIRMEIPNIEKVNRISGKFINTGKGYHKGVLFNIGIEDAYGITHMCGCEPLEFSNCLGRKPSDHREILDQLDAEILKKYVAQMAIVKWLAGQDGEVWMYPNRGLFSSLNSCYQISTNAHTLRSFEQSVQEYSKVKNGVNVYSFWIIMLSGAVALLIFFIIRINAYFKE